MEGLDGKDGKPGLRVRKDTNTIPTHIIIIIIIIIIIYIYIYVYIYLYLQKILFSVFTISNCVLFSQLNRVNQECLALLDPGECRY